MKCPVNLAHEMSVFAAQCEVGIPCGGMHGIQGKRHLGEIPARKLTKILIVRLTSMNPEPDEVGPDIRDICGIKEKET
jgi:hypothetical protein